MKIIEITQSDIKQSITSDILHDLPQWFGIEDSIKEYIDDVSSLPFFVAVENDTYVGFMAVKLLFDNIANLHVLGVKKSWHNKGVGKMLFEKAQEYIQEKNCKYISVYTLSSKANYEPYIRTKKFYESIGFVSLYESDKIWDAENPFLLMVKSLN